MKLTKETLKQIIKEEMEAVMNEAEAAPKFPILPTEIPEDMRKRLKKTIHNADTKGHEFAIRKLKELGYPDLSKKLKDAIDYRTKNYPNYGKAKG